MLSVTQAFDKLLAAVSPLEAVALPLSDVLGLTLAEDVSAPADSPPFDKALMDGFAVRSVDVASGFASLKVIEIVTAGRVPSKSVGPGVSSIGTSSSPVASTATVGRRWTFTTARPSSANAPMREPNFTIYLKNFIK